MWRIFETADDRLTFLVIIPIHEECSGSSETKSESSGTQLKSSGTYPESSERKDFSSERVTKSSERKRKSSERILDLIKNKPTISAAEIAM